MLRNRLVVLICMVSLLCVLSNTAPAALAQAGALCFPQTQQCLDGRLRAFWEQNGGVAIFGYPIAAAAQEFNPETTKSYLTQWFQRNRLELHPQNAPPYDVLLSRLGAAALATQSRDWRAEGREPGPKDGCVWFEPTGHNVCDVDPSGASAADRGFLSYWQTQGLADPQLDAYQRSLALHGQPLTAPRMETNASGDMVLTQWFERARFEWHPDNPPGFRVLLGLLGDELLIEPLPQPVLPASVPWITASNKVVALSAGQPAVVPAGGIASPVGSPDGRYLFFTTTAPFVTELPATRLVLRDVVSGVEQRFDLGYQRLLAAVWSPGSDQVAFTTENARDAVWALSVMNTASGTVSAVLANQATYPPLVPLAWTGEGLFTTAVRVADRLGTNASGLYIVDPATGTSVTVTTAEHGGMAVSPSGRRVAFDAARDPFRWPVGSELVVLDRDTGVQTTVAPAVDDRYFADVRWSPDSTKLVYARRAIGENSVLSLHVIAADGSGEQVLPFGPPELGVLSDVAWRDTSRLQVLMNRRIGTPIDAATARGDVLEISLAGFTPEQVQRIAEVPGGVGAFVYQPRSESATARE